MENNEEDKLNNKQLMEELNNLEDDENSKKARFKEKLKNNRENFIIILVIIVLLVCSVVYYFINRKYHVDYDENSFSEFDEYSEKDNDILDNEYPSYMDYDNEYQDYDEEKEKENFESQKNNIVVSNAYVSVNNELILNIVNNNQEAIYDIEIYVIFYNIDNQIIEITSNSIDFIDANSSDYLKYEETPETYARYETFINKSFYILNNYDNKRENIVYTDSLKDDEVIINVTNSSKEYIDYAEFSIIYYDGQNNILDVEKVDLYELTANSSTEIEGFVVYNYKTGINVPFERYEVILNYAI